MPLAENALTTLEAVKSYLKIPIGTTVDDDTLEDLINACSSAIEDYCERKFKEQTFTEEYDGTGTRYLLLQQYPVNAVNAVSVDDIFLDPSEFKANKSFGKLIRMKSIWPRGDINIAVTYTAGLSEIPASLELACKHFVMSFYKTDVASFSTTFTDGFVFRADSMPSQVKMLIQPYKKVI